MTDEERRLDSRRWIREKLEEFKICTEQRVAAQATIATEEAALEATVQHHEQICAPIQAEVAALDSERIAAVADKQPLSESWRSRRNEVQQRLDAANVALEKAATEHRQKITSLSKALRETQQREMEYLSRFAPDSLQSAQYANPKLWIVATAAGSAVKYAASRRNAAAEMLDKVAARIREKPNLSIGSEDNIRDFAFTRAQARFELQEAEKALAEAKRIHAVALQAVQDE